MIHLADLAEYIDKQRKEGKEQFELLKSAAGK
jgi:hypothetical protein